MRDNQIKLEYDFGQIIRHKLSGKSLIIRSVNIDSNSGVMYGCADKDGKFEYYEDFELEGDKETKIIGFNNED